MVNLIGLLGVACVLQCGDPQLDLVEFASKSAMKTWMNGQNASLMCVTGIHTVVVPVATALLTSLNSTAGYRTDLSTGLVTDTATGLTRVLASSWKEIVASYSTRTYDTSIGFPATHSTLVSTFLPLLRVTVLSCHLSPTPDYASSTNPPDNALSSNAARFSSSPFLLLPAIALLLLAN